MGMENTFSWGQLHSQMQEETWYFILKGSLISNKSITRFSELEFDDRMFQYKTKSRY